MSRLSSLFCKSSGWVNFSLSLSFIIVLADIFFLFPLAALSEGTELSLEAKRDIHATFDSESESDQGIPMNPMDLMERLRRATSLDGATSPSDALDDALKVFNEQGADEINLVQ